MITLAKPELLDGAVLGNGAHDAGKGHCARELLYLIVMGEHKDDTPPCLSESLACLPTLNDMFKNDDALRTSTILPFFPRLLKCERNAEIDRRIAYRLAHHAISVFTADAMESAKLPEWAAKLRAIPPFFDAAAARAAGAAAGAARAAAWAAGAAAWAAEAAAWAAEAAAWAAEAAAWAAEAAARAAEDAARAAEDATLKDRRAQFCQSILEIICAEHGV